MEMSALLDELGDAIHRSQLVTVIRDVTDRISLGKLIPCVVELDLFF
jgi:hypothetical protein